MCSQSQKWGWTWVWTTHCLLVRHHIKFTFHSRSSLFNFFIFVTVSGLLQARVDLQLAIQQRGPILIAVIMSWERWLLLWNEPSLEERRRGALIYSAWMLIVSGATDIQRRDCLVMSGPTFTFWLMSCIDVFSDLQTTQVLVFLRFFEEEKCDFLQACAPVQRWWY